MNEREYYFYLRQLLVRLQSQFASLENADILQQKLAGICELIDTQLRELEQDAN